MSNLELVLNIRWPRPRRLKFQNQKKPKGFVANQHVARMGGGVAGRARKDIEKKTGRSAISDKNARGLGMLGHNDLKSERLK